MSIIRSSPPDRRRRFTSHCFLRFSVHFLTPLMNNIFFIRDKRSLCFLHLTDLSIHKQRKTQVSWVSVTDSYGEKYLPALQLHFAHHQNRVCKQRIVCCVFVAVVVSVLCVCGSLAQTFIDQLMCVWSVYVCFWQDMASTLAQKHLRGIILNVSVNPYIIPSDCLCYWYSITC